MTPDMGSRVENNVLNTQPDQLGRSEAGLERENEERMIAPPVPRHSTRSCKQRVDLGGSEEVDLPAHMSLRRYCEHPLDERAPSRLLQSNVCEERANGRQAHVATPRADAPDLLEVIEKRRNEWRVEVFKREGWLPPPLVSGANLCRLGRLTTNKSPGSAGGSLMPRPLVLHRGHHR
jgi:hypothetical protein